MGTMTVDDALGISRAHVSVLWKRCDRAAGETPEALRERALKVLAEEVERLRDAVIIGGRTRREYRVIAQREGQVRGTTYLTPSRSEQT